MPSKTDKQQNFFRMVKGVKSGDVPEKDVSDRIKKVAKSLDDKDIDDFIEENAINDNTWKLFAPIEKYFSRKATDWRDVNEIPKHAINQQLNLWIVRQFKDDKVLDLPRVPTAYFPGSNSETRNVPNYFVGKYNDSFYLVDTEGYEYSRYAAKLPDGLYNKYSGFFESKKYRIKLTEIYSLIKESAYSDRLNKFINKQWETPTEIEIVKSIERGLEGFKEMSDDDIRVYMQTVLDKIPAEDKEMRISIKFLEDLEKLVK